MASLRVFVVTGANKGIGKSIVKLLLQDPEEKVVYLTSRNKELGEHAVGDLKKQGLNPIFHQLDITDRESIEKLRDNLTERHGGLDVLVNNAGIAYKVASTVPFGEQAEVTNNCNFYGTLKVCEILFPILRKNGRVVNVSSMASEYAYRRLSSEMKMKFGDPNLTMDGLKSLMSEFIQSAKNGTTEEKGFAQTAYGMSKVGVTLMTQIQQREFDEADQTILINSCCPGYVATDMSSYKGPLQVDEGADTPCYLALLGQNAILPRGCFHKLREVIPYPPQV